MKPQNNDFNSYVYILYYQTKYALLFYTKLG